MTVSHRVTLGSLALLGTVAGLSRSAWLVEDVYAARIGPWIGQALTSISRLVPFSLAEVIVASAIVALLVALLRSIRDAARHRRAAGPAIAARARRSVALLSSAAALFYLLWGIHYARADLVKRAGWSEHTAPPPSNAAAADELAALAAQLVEATNRDYRDAFGTEDIGGATVAPRPMADVDRAIDEGYAAAARDLGWSDAFAASRGPAKPLALSVVLSYQGVGGFYFPWTGEANYNRLAPGHELPHDIAHEKAHQRGITDEAEASFAGYIACDFSPDAYARYSGHLFAQRQLLRELIRLDEGRAMALVARRLPGVQRDVDAARVYWAQYDGLARRAQTRSNDTFLKLNGIADGVAAYARSAELLVVYARAQGGRVVK